MTRPSKYKKADYPDTECRMDGLYCKDCYRLVYPERDTKRKVPTDEDMVPIVSAYQHWLERRHQRLYRRQGPHLPPYVRQKRIYQ
jgi:hypothetical protein